MSIQTFITETLIIVGVAFLGGEAGRLLYWIFKPCTGTRWRGIQIILTIILVLVFAWNLQAVDHFIQFLGGLEAEELKVGPVTVIILVFRFFFWAALVASWAVSLPIIRAWKAWKIEEN